ncbi:hypothetical protein FisN_2Hh223 [Fistulifera solaris]|jgi:ATP/ADP translocase|uniref:ADP,ATP carrier protein n=1 Tax=Fistulifera solaris TaxID=1519565 RepID=A0A1Z5JET6_FISSO|nr:hypothetical protein FisN_2Hh223 [Fistulifera solaris]|eukprot:GAX12392.1 hypothetical protein FisN_2Hh223 [Fistulifera solaris]
MKATYYLHTISFLLSVVSTEAFARSEGRRLLPVGHALTTGIATITTPTRLSASIATTSDPDIPSSHKMNVLPRWKELPPRAQSVALMGIGMSLHFGGYEFIRNACLSLFTSADYGFTSAAAFPLANGLVSPFSVLLLYLYGKQLDQVGPRGALYRSTVASMVFIAIAATLLKAFRVLAAPKACSQALIGLVFLFQNSYQYLLYSQHWSFVTSVLTPEEGSRWISRLAGIMSITSSLLGQTAALMLPFTGLIGLLAATCVTLVGTLLCADKAYAVASQHGFDPTQASQKKKKEKTTTLQSSEKVKQNKFVEAYHLFQRVPTLGALFVETVSFQTLSNILNVAFVQALKVQIPNDVLRSAYSSRLFSISNFLAAAFQFMILPAIQFEPKTVWRLMPLVPFAACLTLALQHQCSLALLGAAFGVIKLLDYSLRNVVYVTAYQTLDYESRYVGKEIVSVLGSRLGKSGVSLVLSGLTGFGFTGLPQLIQFSLASCGVWQASSWCLSKLVPTRAEAQAIFEERRETENAVVENKNAVDIQLKNAGSEQETNGNKTADDLVTSAQAKKDD